MAARRRPGHRWSRCLASAAVLALAACSAPGAPAAVGPPAGGTGPRTLVPEDYGAAGDGRTDDTAALARALATLRPGETLALTAGRTYAHDDVLELTTPRVRLTGPGTLLATDEERSSLQVAADDVEVRDLVLRISATSRRWDAPDQHRLYVGDVRGTRVRGVTVLGSAAAGVFVNGARDFALVDLRVEDTRADGIHMTGGSTGGTVHRPVVSRSGDDGIAVVSYGQDTGTTSGISVLSPTVRGVVRGRGISVVGGEDVVYRDVDLSDTYAAGVYVATEGDPYYTRATRGVRVLGGTVTRANRGDDIDHGALLVSAGSQQSRVTDVLLADLAVDGTGPAASAQVGLRGRPGDVEGVRLERLRVTGGGALFGADTGGASFTATGWTVDGEPVPDVGGA